MENFTIVLRQWFVQNGHGRFASLLYEKSSSASSPIKDAFFFPASNCSFVIKATPMAPMIPGYGARITSRPRYCSSAQSTASFSNVPPCTTIRSPRESTLEIRMTLVNTFSMIERHSPAIISSGSFPFRCSVIILLFINTVQRLPRAAGCSDENAAEAISCMGICRFAAKFPRNEPHPEEQASLTRMLVIMP